MASIVGFSSEPAPEPEPERTHSVVSAELAKVDEKINELQKQVIDSHSKVPPRPATGSMEEALDNT